MLKSLTSGAYQLRCADCGHVFMERHYANGYVGPSVLFADDLIRLIECHEPMCGKP